MKKFLFLSAAIVALASCGTSSHRCDFENTSIDVVVHEIPDEFGVGDTIVAERPNTTIGVWKYRERTRAVFNDECTCVIVEPNKQSDE
jgi:hypothetical protein